MDDLDKGSTSNEHPASACHMPGTELRAPACPGPGTGRAGQDVFRRPGGAGPARAASLARSGLSAATGFLLVVAGLLALPLQAQAQTVQTLVSNTGQTVSNTTGFVGPLSADLWRTAQGFTTGDSEAGYTLSSVDLYFGAIGGTEAVTVSIYEADASGNPGSSLHVLSTPATVANGLNTFTALANATLDKETDYIVVVEGAGADFDDSFSVALTDTDDEDSGAASGWSIASGRLSQRNDIAWIVSAGVFRIEIKGTVDGGTVLSTDAILSALALSGVTLAPTFVSSTETYTATVVNSVMQTTVTATTAHSGATVAFKDGDDTALTNPVTLAVGANVIKAVVTAEDTTTMKTYMVTVTREGTTDTLVTIEAEHESIGAGLEDLLFTLTRAGDTTDALDVTVTITQAQTWLGNSDLEHDVTFSANSATAELTITASNFSFTPSTTGNLTATVSGDDIDGGSDTVQIISTSGPPITISYEESAYTFAEEATDEAIYVLATLDAAYPRGPGPSISVPIAFSSRSGTAVSPEDFAAITWNPNFLRSDFERDVETDPLVARKAVPGFAIVNDDIYEGSESFEMTMEFAPGLSADLVQFANPDGTTCIGFTCAPKYPVTITDEGDLPELSLSVDPPSIAEEDDDGTTSVAENVSTVTVGITNGKTFAVDKTATLTFSGTATQGTHYSVSPGDADSGTGGHQVVLAKETASVEVTVTAVGNDTADGPRTVTVKGTLGAKDIGSSRDITILDDETTTTAPAIVTDGVQVTSTAATGDTYGLGEPIEITVTFDTAVTVDTSGGTPRIQFVLNGGGTPVTKWAEYSSGSGGTALVFTYTVQAGDMDDDGIWLPANFLQLQGGTISAAADTTVAATLTYAQPGTQSEHKVDGGPTLSTDATLSALALSGVTLDPTFVSATEDYTATVGNAVTETTVTATPTHSGATVAFKDGDDTALTNPVTLAEGATVIKAVVTAEDTTTMKTYMVTVTRETTTTSDDATLSALALSGVTLAPTFASATEDYTATVGNAVTETTVTATPTHSGATVAFKDGDDNALTNPVTLAEGATVIKAVVTAEDTTTMKTYMVTVTRETTTTSTAPAIVTDGVQVTSTPMATTDTYGLGETIAITVTFDNPVTVNTSGGTPRIQFRLDGAVNKWAEYSSSSGGTALVFTYRVQAGDMDDDGIRLPANFLRLQSGTIRDATDTTVDATLTYTQSGPQSGHKVDGSLTTNPRPAIVTGGVQVTSTPMAMADTYGLGETIAITVTFDNAVTVDTSGGTPRIAFRLDADPNPNRWAVYSSGSGGTALVFTYRVQADDRDADGIRLPANTIQLFSGTIVDATDPIVDATLTYAAPGLQSGHKVNGSLITTIDEDDETTTTPPAIVTGGVQVTSTPMATGDTYGLGETIAITVTFDNAVTVDTSGGTPRIAFRLDGDPNPNRWAEYSSGSGGTALVFTYTVQAGDMDTDGIRLPANSIQLFSGTIVDATDPIVDATLTYADPGLQSGHKVDGSLTTTDAATLSALALSGVTLAPTFVSSTETYTATVGNAVTETTVTATPTHSGATVAFKDGDDNALTNPVTLAVGANVIKAVVTAEDTTTMKTYMVTVTRAGTTTTTAPAIVTDGVQVTSTPMATTDTYGLGETIAITVTFDKAVTVDTSGGTPRIAFRLDGDPNPNRWAEYSSGSGGTALVFTYTVLVDDMAVNGILLAANTIQLFGGTIVDATDPIVDATLTYAAPGLQSGHKVDGSLTTTTNEDDGTTSTGTGGGGGGGGTTNSPPAITTTSPQSVAENMPAVVTLAATDTDSGDTLTWSKNGGADASAFTLTTAGVLSFASAPNFEDPTDTGTDNGYEVTVRVSDGTAPADLALTVNVTDVAEQPDRPAAPAVSATAGTTTSLDVGWTAPGLNGGPALTGYDLQYREGTSGPFTEGPQAVAGLSTAITDLMAGTAYQVQVRALNRETPSDWSPSGTGSTEPPEPEPVPALPLLGQLLLALGLLGMGRRVLRSRDGGSVRAMQ